METQIESSDSEFQKTDAPDKTLLITKLYIPPPCQILVPRPRLTNALSKTLASSLTLVSAPAGYGKTTLVSSWLLENHVPSTWLSLDDGDNDPLRFLQYLIIALQKIISEIQLDLLNVLQGTQPNPFEALINIVINQIAGRAAPFIFVLDDFHTIHAQPVLEIIAYLIEHIPSQLHLIIITRTDPPLLLSRLRVRGQLVDIRENQLRFTREEVVSFLNEGMGLKLSDDAITALETRTEGWIAGLQLASIAMQSYISMQGSKDVHAFISAFTGSHHYVMDYLIEEVLKRQPKEVSAFLLKTSFLDRMCGSLCESIVETDKGEPVDGQAMLEALEGMNLFVIPLDEERRWYRYHHLFADVLRKRLERQLPHLVPKLHQRASQWYEQNGFLSEAIQQAIVAGDQDRAAHLLEDNGCFLLMSGEVATLLGWADVIEFQSEVRPWLAIQKAWALALTGDLERVEPTLQAPEKLLAPLEHTVEVRTMLGTIAAARAQCASQRVNSQLAAEYARQALELLPDCSSISQSIRSVATSILGDASWINGDLEEAKRAYTEAIRIGREANNLNMVIIANSSIADILVTQGQLHQAADKYTKSLQMAVRPDGQRSPLAISIFASMGKLSYEWNRLDDAEQNIRQCMELSRTWGDTGQQAYAYIIQARLEQARGHPKEAGEAIREAERLISEYPDSPYLSIQMKSFLARVWLAQGNLEKPSQYIQQRGLKINDEIPYKRKFEYDLLLQVLIARGEHEAAINLSNRLLQQAETTGQIRSLIQILILQALALQGKKETEQALLALEKALTLAQPEGYVRSFLDEGEAMTRLLCLVQSRQAGSGYAAVLLSKIGKISSMTQPSMQLLIDPLTTREVEVLKYISTGCSNQDIADQLFISIPTVKRHISNIYTKLGVKSRTQAVSIGKELKIFE